MNKAELREEDRIRALEARTTTWLRVAVVQQILLVGLLASTYLSLDAKIAASHAHNAVKMQSLEQAARLDTHDTRLDALELGRIKHDTRLDAIELGLIKHDARLEVLERGTASNAHETRETLRQLSVAVADAQSQRAVNNKPARTSSPPQVHERQLQAAQNEDRDRAVIRVDAPDGRSQFVMGARAAVDNVIMEKEHADEGGDFTLSRNLTRVLGISVDGAVTVHTNPFNVASMVRSADSPLYLQGQGGVNLRSQTSFTVQELDGQGRWSTQALRVHVGDSVEWTWTNYHNVVQTDAAGSIKAGGVSSGVPVLTSAFTHTFEAAGTYYFKSQAQFTMTCTVEVLESFVLQNGKVTLGGDLEVGGNVLQNGKVTLGGDLEVGGNVRAAGHALAGIGFETEIKMFLANECPTGWMEATELGGYFLMGRAPGGQVNETKNRPMNASEEGRMHSTYYRGDPTAYGYANDDVYDDRYFGGYVSANGGGARRIDVSCTSGSCTQCSLPGSSTLIDCKSNFGKYQTYDHYYKDRDYGNRFALKYDKLTNPAFQTSTYMAPIGEYYPFASVLLCKRV